MQNNLFDIRGDADIRIRNDGEPPDAVWRLDGPNNFPPRDVCASCQSKRTQNRRAGGAGESSQEYSRACFARLYTCRCRFKTGGQSVELHVDRTIESLIAFT